MCLVKSSGRFITFKFLASHIVPTDACSCSVLNEAIILANGCLHKFTTRLKGVLEWARLNSFSSLCDSAELKCSFFSCIDKVKLQTKCNVYSKGRIYN